MSDPQRHTSKTHDFSPTVLHRCSCGREMRINPILGGRCESCGQNFSPSTLETALAATLDFSSTPSDPIASLHFPPADLAGTPTQQKLGHYRIVDALGQGGMGTVYRAFDESLQRYVALKVMHAPSGSNTSTQHIQRLLQEAIAQARVNHPGIAHIYFVGVEQNSPFFAMELVNGPTLKQRLQNGPLPFPEMIDCAQQMVSALRHAAEFDILHGDIKPGNILLTPSGTVKLSDFGLARRLSEISSQEGRITGTPDYLAPEAIAAKPLDLRSDMYSLGVTFFEMTFGRLPYTYTGNHVMERLRAHQEGAVEFPSPWPDKIPRAWRDVLAKLLSKTPTDRYANYNELMHDLVRLSPGTLHPGGIGPRSLAWFVDLGLANTTLQILAAPITSGFVKITWLSTSMLQLGLALFSIVILLLIALLQAYWGKTPGKKLFLLRIVDRHGLAVQKPILFARMLVQLLPLWAGILFEICRAMGATYLGQILASLTMLVVLIDLGWALFHQRRRCLHDLLFRTRVVLDTQSSISPTTTIARY